MTREIGSAFIFMACKGVIRSLRPKKIGYLQVTFGRHSPVFGGDDSLYLGDPFRRHWVRSEISLECVERRLRNLSLGCLGFDVVFLIEALECLKHSYRSVWRISCLHR